MTDNKWKEIVSHVLERLKKEPSFSVDKEEFFKRYDLADDNPSEDLADDDSMEFIRRRDHPNEKHFGFRREEVNTRLRFIFSREETPS